VSTKIFVKPFLPEIVKLRVKNQIELKNCRGKEIVAELGDVNSSLYLKHCEDICYGHHERWDGKGYPRQLKGK
jgi:HD-GYP domain-containing protein (c-di-GMP phosphodiesterase class II)